MKCIYCGQDSKYRDRTGRKCAHCHKHFAFEPKEGDPFTDVGFKAAIDAVSAQGQVRWGVEHLYYQLCRRLHRREFAWRWVFLPCALSAGFFYLLGIPVAILVAIPFWILVWLLLRRFGQSVTLRWTQEEFDRMWNCWTGAHGFPEGVIQRKEKPSRKRPAEADIGDYSFDRAVICDRARTVDLLLANNFHFENNCAVLAVGGYPQRPFETVRAMLKRNPKLQVFALHDANVAGCKLAHKLAHDPEWFQGHVPVTDVGLRPGHAKPFEGLYLPAAAPALTPGEGIADDEIPWLQKYSLELAAIRPEQVLKRLFQAINRKGEETAKPRADSDDCVDYDDRSFLAYAGDSDGGADAFG